MSGWLRGAAAALSLAVMAVAGTVAHAQETVAPAGQPEVDGADVAAPFGSPVEDDRVYFHALFDELEGLFGGSAGSQARWDGQAWLGTDTNRLWFKTEGQVWNGRVQDGEQELLYDRPMSAFFDLQAGVRYDLDSAPGRGWGALGIEGVAPYFFDVSATMYASDGGHFAARMTASHELLLTQRLILTPSVELNAYSRADAQRDIGSGVSDAEAGLRLRYEISRKFAPYVGLVYQRIRGIDAAGSIAGWRAAAGVRAWW